MAKISVMPRPTPAERPDRPVEVEIDEAFTIFINTIEDWAAPRGNWEFTLHEGHDFGRANNVEARLLYVAGEQSSEIRFRIDQLDDAEDTADVLALRFEERDGIAKMAWLTSNGLEVEFFHILTFT
jgi:hypothetical protein